MFSSIRVDKSKGTKSEGSFFEGTVYRQSIGQSDELDMDAVFFENGARTVPHVHYADQVLIVVEGTCVVADAGERRLLGVGEVALVKNGEWHWHGAAKNSSACHVSLRKSCRTEVSEDKKDWADW